MTERTALDDRIQRDLVQAMKARDAERVGVLRLVKTALQNKTIELKRALAPEEEIQLLKTMIKQRGESIEMYEKGGRAELAQKEADERVVLETYLPESVSEDEMRLTAAQVAEELGASSNKDMGRVMKETMSRLAATGKTVDNKALSGIVRETLS